MVWLLVSQALAGSGPWVIGTGQINAYIGGEAQRLERLHIQGPGGEGADVIDVDSGLSTVGLKGIVTLGLAPRVDLSVDVPVYRVMANRAGALCEALGQNACGTTTTLGVVSFQGKGLILDELTGAPFSLSLSLEGRLGAFTHPTRMRITNAGEGTQDLGGILSIGRSGGLGKGYWSAYLDGGARYRFANTKVYPQQTGDVRAPQEEIFGTSEVTLSPDRRFGFGPVVTVFARPGGLDFTELDLSDPDRLAALRVANCRVGGTLVVRSERSLSANITVLQTAVAMNNPYVTSVNVGLSVYGAFRDRSNE